MSGLSVVVIQPTSLCNLNCKYCYISEEDRKNKYVMSYDTLEQAIKLIFSHDDLNSQVLINWHAGEPLMAGIDFYRKASSLIQAYRKNRQVEQSIQTNGVSLNPAWCSFLSESGIGVSVSLDGPKFIHNANRVNWGGKGSFDYTLRGINLLKDFNIPFYVLMVLTEKCLDFPREIYDFFIEQKIPSFGFNVEEMTGSNLSSSLKSRIEIELKYKTFIKTLVDLWKKNPKTLTIRELEAMSQTIFQVSKNKLFHPYRIESSQGILTIKSNGDIVPFSPEMGSGTSKDRNSFVVGNVHTISQIGDIYQTEKYTNMRNDIDRGISKCKESCSYFSLCGGGNPGNKMYENQSFNSTETNHCKYHYQYIAEVLLNSFSKETAPFYS